MRFFVQTLTAYRLEFSYLKRNNPLKDTLKDKLDESVDYSLDKFVSELAKKSTKDYDFSKETGRLLVLFPEDVEQPKAISSHKIRYFFKPSFGKRNLPTTMIPPSAAERTVTFPPNWTSTTKANVFLYNIDQTYYAVFHRFGGSGCKTVFLSTANAVLKEEGLKLEMTWLPFGRDDEDLESAEPAAISLIYKKQVSSSDIADHLNGASPKKRLIKVKELNLNLNFPEYNSIRNFLHRFQAKEISKNATLDGIKESVGDGQYNDATVTLRMGRFRRRVRWDDFEQLFNGYDITEEMKGPESLFFDRLKDCSDKFIDLVVEKQK